jgi:hypothetical protein
VVNIEGISELSGCDVFGLRTYMDHVLELKRRNGEAPLR